MAYTIKIKAKRRCRQKSVYASLLLSNGVLEKEDIQMAVRLQDLYEQVSGEDIQLVAGEGGLCNVVSWTHMVESKEIVPFLEEGQISFTTGVALQNSEELFSLVKEVYEQQASGMVINVGPFISEIPKEVIDFGLENNFPIFRVPWSVNMAHIIRSFVTRITESERINMEMREAIKNAIYFPEREELYVPTLESFDYFRDLSYCLVIGNVYEKNSKVLAVRERRQDVFRLIQRYLTSFHNGVYVFDIENQLVLIFSSYKEKTIRVVMNKIIKEIETYLPGKTDCFFGIGQATKNIACIHKSYYQAKNVLSLQCKRLIGEPVSLYRAQGVYKLIMSPSAMSRDNQILLKEFYEETLGPLERYDTLNHTNYMDVLMKLMKNQGSIKETAEELFLHRNSINYKVQKITEILQMDLSLLDTKIRISMALMVKEVL